MDYLQNRNITFITDGGNIYLPGLRINNWGCQRYIFFKISVLNCERSVINGYGLVEKYSIRGMSRSFRTNVPIITAAHDVPQRVKGEFTPAPKQLAIQLHLAARFTINLDNTTDDETRRKP